MAGLTLRAFKVGTGLTMLTFNYQVVHNIYIAQKLDSKMILERRRVVFFFEQKIDLTQNPFYLQHGSMACCAADLHIISVLLF